MDCYNDLSPSRGALYAIGNIRILPSFLEAAALRHLFNNQLEDSPGGMLLEFSLQITVNVLPPKQ